MPKTRLFILYTSGSTGKPKGVLHTTGGYLLQVAMTHKLVFDYKDGEVYWCTADIGWVTGHSYIVYGPLANGAITLMFEGIPTYPDAGRFWQVCDKHNVATFYTAPTAIRMLIGAGRQFVDRAALKSLRLLGTVGEPINPEAWEWYYHVVGRDRCPIVDTWWQTETGAHMLTPLPGATPLKPGSATHPFFGVEPVLLDDQGNEIDGSPAEGNLAIKHPWPSMMRTLYGDHKRFSRPTSPCTRAITSPVTARAATRTAITGSPAASTTCSTSPGTAWAPPRSNPRWSCTPRSPRPRWSATRTNSPARASTPMSP